jgi:predicted GNAT superfamily acetyltransferase
MKEIAEILMTFGKALCHKLPNRIWFSQYPDNLVFLIDEY